MDISRRTNGMLKMHEEIVVHVDVLFTPAAGPASQAQSLTSGKSLTEGRRY